MSRFLTHGCLSDDKFYGITVKLTNDAAAFKNINLLAFEAANFYLHQNAPNTDEVIISLRAVGSGEVNTASNLGAGEGLFTTKSGVNLPFKSLVAGTNITLSSDANEVTINSTGGGAGSGFYGITVAESDGDPSFSGINKINFKANDFYLTQEFGNTDEVLIQARPFARVYLNFSFETVSRTIEVPIEQQMVVHDEIEVINPDGSLNVEGTVVLET